MTPPHWSANTCSGRWDSTLKRSSHPYVVDQAGAADACGGEYHELARLRARFLQRRGISNLEVVRPESRLTQCLRATQRELREIARARLDRLPRALQLAVDCRCDGAFFG